ncbi:MAG: hypothetical protein K6E38_07985 [Fretibacterium sp.]|nr:hypothetical protein [Fretibacterium sp.]
MTVRGPLLCASGFLPGSPGAPRNIPRPARPRKGRMMNSCVDKIKGGIREPGAGGTRRFYPVRDPEDPGKVGLIPISEELYRGLYPLIWQTQKRMRRQGRCSCPRSKLWGCDVDCPVCRYRTEGNRVSLDDADGEITADAVLMDSAPSPEALALQNDLLESIWRELDELDPAARQICGLMMEGSGRGAAAALKMSRSVFRRQWEKTRIRLRERLRDFIA